MKYKLTLKELKEIEAGTIFARGVIEDNPRGINMMNSGKLLKWVAVRGDIEDWCIYCAYDDENTYTGTRDFGEKVNDEENIKRLIPCDNEAFKMYRY